jgi:hypothetical protein
MPMSPRQKEQLIASWLLLQRSQETGSQREDLSWVVEKIWDLCDDAPNEALQFIFGVLEHDASGTSMTLLSAGPLEALLRKHGPRIIGRVERRARHDPRFACLLDHVWQNSVSERIWERVLRARERSRAPATDES